MKKTIIKLLPIALLAISILSCSTKKNRFLNRALHSTATKYNVMYNGKVAYNAQKKQLDENYKDDFWNILPIEPLKINEEIALPSSPFSKNPNNNSNNSSSGGFAKAEEKAVKAVQKHTMNIGGKERNKQIDDAYFLLGKSRYFDQRFIPALETFKYIVKHYPDSDLFNPARIWEAKSLIRLGIEDEAKYKLDLLLELKELPDETKVDALTALAMAFSKQDSIQNVVNLLDSTLLYKTKNSNQRARNLFILGQLYRKQNKIDSSNIIFDKLLAFKKAPYRFKIYSQLERAKNYNKETDNTEALVNSLEKLARNRDNRPYLDGIFYQLGKIKLTNNNTDKAAEYFKKTLRTKQVHKKQKSLAYEDIGNILFDKAAFLKAGLYYDSVLDMTQNKNTKRIRKLIRKRKSLNEVIRLENIRHKNDSILNLASLSKDEQTKIFSNYIKILKNKDEEAKNIAKNKKTSGFGSSLIGGSKQNTKGNKFYFYNSQTVGFGKAEFQKIWGNRELVDNWRLSNKKAITPNSNDAKIKTNTNDAIDDTKKYNIDYYLSRIPTNKSTLDSISTKRNNAYYNLGLIYKEQFKKYELATNMLETLLNNSPTDKMVLPTYYHLYKAFENYNIEKSNFYKNKITTEYADSRYAQIINNPNTISEDTNKNSPENTYKATYKLYENEQYNQVLKACSSAISKFSSTAIIPKFELLKAYAIAKTTTKNEFIKALQFVVTNYPNTEEGIHAKKVIASLKGEAVTENKKTATKNKTIKEKKRKEKKKETKKNLPSKQKMLELIKKNKKSRNMGPPNHK